MKNTIFAMLIGLFLTSVGYCSVVDQVKIKTDKTEISDHSLKTTEAIAIAHYQIDVDVSPPTKHLPVKATKIKSMFILENHKVYFATAAFERQRNWRSKNAGKPINSFVKIHKIPLRYC